MLDVDIERRRRLGDFLRAQRRLLLPEAAGLPATGRRRTPGLRREEVALLAGISATWYTRIEQGRDVSMSRGAATRLADALRLGRAARRHLLDLAGHAEPVVPASGADALPAAIVASVAAVTAPAYVLDATWTARAWNEAAASLFHDWLGAGGRDRNLLRYVFLAASARRFVVDWDTRARRLLAEFRADCAGRAGEPPFAPLIAELRAGSALFGRWWDEQQVVDREGGERAFLLPDGRVARLHQLTLVPTTEPGLKLVMLLDSPD